MLFTMEHVQHALHLCAHRQLAIFVGITYLAPLGFLQVSVVCDQQHHRCHQHGAAEGEPGRIQHHTATGGG